jgi:3-methyladenine DNA glycosylase AlkD
VTPTDLAAYVLAWIRDHEDPYTRAGVSAYMKIGLRGDPNPPAGVSKAVLKQLVRELKKSYRPSTEAELLSQIEALWEPRVRESKYVAIDHARAFQTLLGPAALPAIERMIREAGWWDLVDGLAGWLVAPIYLRHRTRVRPVLDRWRRDPDLWLRRSVLLAHLAHRHATDLEALFDDVLTLAHEKEFFIRKAIGWVLRDLSYSRPNDVQSFLEAHGGALSGLSRREASKQLRRVAR